MDEPDETPLAPNQVIAYNLRLARALRKWTQEKAAEELEPHLGTKWSKAVFSAAERSVDGKRVRPFDADEIVAFAKAFDLPVLFFLLPPPGYPWEATHPLTTSALELLQLILPTEEGLSLIQERLDDVLRHASGELLRLSHDRRPNLVALVATSAIGNTIKEASDWAARLTELADLLDYVSQKAESALSKPDTEPADLLDYVSQKAESALSKPDKVPISEGVTEKGETH